MLIHEDPHLNLFWVYGSRIKDKNDSDITNVNYLENNITKALINTIENLPADSCRISFLKACGVLPQDAEASSLEFEFRMQRKPDKSVVTSFPESKRFLWGISPSGEAWDIGKIPLEKIDFSNRKESIHFILEQIKNDVENQDNEKDFAQKAATRLFDEIEAIQNNKGESIPDGWILIYKNHDKISERKPLYCIAIENKWHKLDPYQLVNHWKKALYYAEGKTSFSKYAEIYNNISRYSNESPIASQFLEYMSLIGQEPFTCFRENDFSILLVKENDNLTKYQEAVLERYQKLISKKFWKYFEGFMADYVKRFNLEHLKHGFSVEYDEKRARLCVNKGQSFNLYFDFNREKGVFQISTEVGVKEEWVNRCLLPFLKANNNLVSQLESQYKNCTYSRHIRLKGISDFEYFWIKDYDTLEDYLNVLNTNRIAISKRSKEECIDDLQKLITRVKYNIKRLENFTHKRRKTWHWLEYLRIVENVNIAEYCGEDAVKQLNNILTECINRHCEGIRRLDELLSEAQK